MPAPFSRVMGAEDRQLKLGFRQSPITQDSVTQRDPKGDQARRSGRGLAATLSTMRRPKIEKSDARAC
jgi:hypothetical protein